MAFENVDLFDAVANASLEKYGWQDRCEAKLIVLSENATYMVKNKETGEKEGVLRISRPGYHTLDELNSEMKWLRQINDYMGVRCAARLLWFTQNTGDYRTGWKCIFLRYM